MNEALWYNDEVSEDQWIEDWVYITNLYKDHPNFIGADLNNEPHDEATWDNWKTAAEKCGKAVLEVRPDLLILVEGVEEDTQGRNYWWGGNLSDARENPIDHSMIPSENLIYSPHEYGPTVWPQDWFTDPSFPENMPEIWDEYFWFIHKENMGHLLIGEFGIKHDELADTESAGHIWFTEFLEYAGHEASWTFWTFNPNSGDTGGILLDDWVTIDELKYNTLAPYLEPVTYAGDDIQDDETSDDNESTNDEQSEETSDNNESTDDEQSEETSDDNESTDDEQSEETSDNNESTDEEQSEETSDNNESADEEQSEETSDNNESSNEGQSYQVLVTVTQNTSGDSGNTIPLNFDIQNTENGSISLESLNQILFHS